MMKLSPISTSSAQLYMSESTTHEHSELGLRKDTYEAVGDEEMKNEPKEYSSRRRLQHAQRHLSDLVQAILVALTGQEKAQMWWSKPVFNKLVTVKYGLRIVGWPNSVAFTGPSRMSTSISVMEGIIKKWEKGVIRFEWVDDEADNGQELEMPVRKVRKAQRHKLRRPKTRAKHKDIRRGLCSPYYVPQHYLDEE